MKSANIRDEFLDYFKQQDHVVVPSSSLVPHNDPSLLFTNSGMVQFKDVFLGNVQRQYSRAVSIQRCLRAGGKHNDLENVGYTTRHHTFFEMMGNFSFGGYFKQDAIRYSWEFLTDRLKIPAEKLWITVHQQDEESARIWMDGIGVPSQRISYCGDEDNFWSMGETGPCGPCSEIFYDHGPDIAGGPPGSPDADGDRYVEIWNLVFMQYNRDKQGILRSLPRPCVDTGMGLERIAAVMQGVHDNYETDLFAKLVDIALFQAENPHPARIRAGDTYADKMKAAMSGEDTTYIDNSNKALRVIADHVRSTVYLIFDGVTPSNEGRGYVLRRIIRRAIRHGYYLGIDESLFECMVNPFIAMMRHPQLKQNRDLIHNVIQQEERQFNRTLGRGLHVLETAISNLDSKVIPGEIVFKLYDTYGFPADLTTEIAREQSLGIDLEGFERIMSTQKARARAASKFAKISSVPSMHDVPATYFHGYIAHRIKSRIIKIFHAGESVPELATGLDGWVVLADTPFYAESGGQVGDVGKLTAEPGTHFDVQDTQCYEGVIVHIGKVIGDPIRVEDQVIASIDRVARNAAARSHSATHLLHSTLQHIVGEHVQQKGSFVGLDSLRFDFSHTKPLTREELEEIEHVMLERILANDRVCTREMSLENAKAYGAQFLDRETYPDPVRVVFIGDMEYSVELCGGTHVQSTGEIGLFKIVSETSVAHGIRRISAVTMREALSYIHETERCLGHIQKRVSAGRSMVEDAVASLDDRNKQLEKDLDRMTSRNILARVDTLLTDATLVLDKNGNRTHIILANVEDIDSKGLRKMVDHIKSKMQYVIVVLGAVVDSKVSLVVGVQTPSIPVDAAELVNHVARQVGGRGGGRSDFAQGAGNNPHMLDAALQSVSGWIQERL